MERTRKQKQKNKYKVSGLKRAILSAAAAAAAALVVLWAPFQRLEYTFADSLFIKHRPVDNRIKIIGIDEESQQELGPFSGWTRQQAADLLNAFDPEHAPAVIAFDINYFGERDSQGDDALAKAASQYEYVVMASYLDYSARLEQLPDGSYYMNTMYVQQIEKPYEALFAVTRHGFTNTVQDSDNYVRRTLFSAESEGSREYSFAWTIYSSYMENQGGQPVFPETDDRGVYGFDYTAEPGMYELYSYADVVAGRCDVRVFQDSIVLVGAYASGMMDQYMAPVARSTVMNGVEVQANHVNALLDGRTYTNIATWLSVLITASIVFAYTWLACGGHFALNLVGAAVLELAVPLTARLLYSNGLYWRCLTAVVAVAVVFLAQLAFGYLTERFRKYRILQMFRTYMAPQVVDELSKSGNYQIELGGRSSQIAVLFVDIRGFTSMSEGLPPDQVVGILNRYLGRVTEAIFKNDGTLDKFIGDAVMAVYNAPVDVEDYMVKAVRTGIDIIRSVESLNDELERDFGCRIGCGVGIHWGKAVVGNIGCDFRMDYTAIGDTVNVAERLESIAKPGQVLISEQLYEQVKDQFRAEYIGEQELKGRQDKVAAFTVEF
ncbi:MAG: adenylate/guanylate cyclase domain-containing protein [Acetatifactor sp.]|nr:adenylate/guanylate cyclase domain-containing protein [Acetatifactor sp.]